jgi:hypothetical protein
MMADTSALLWRERAAELTSAFSSPLTGFGGGGVEK